MILERKTVEIVDTPCCSHGRYCDLCFLYKFLKRESSQITEERLKTLSPSSCFWAPNKALVSPIVLSVGMLSTANIYLTKVAGNFIRSHELKLDRKKKKIPQTMTI